MNHIWTNNILETLLYQIDQGIIGSHLPAQENWALREDVRELLWKVSNTLEEKWDNSIGLQIDCAKILLSNDVNLLKIYERTKLQKFLHEVGKSYTSGSVTLDYLYSLESLEKLSIPVNEYDKINQEPINQEPINKCVNEDKLLPPIPVNSDNNEINLREENLNNTKKNNTKINKLIQLFRPKKVIDYFI